MLAGTLIVLATSPALADLRPLCPDRPGKGTSACTVDDGSFQIESDLFNETVDRAGGVETDTIFVTNPNLKYGVSDDVDVEADLSPDVIVHTRVFATRHAHTVSGLGDLFLRAKWAAIGNSGSDFALALDADLKIPTAAKAIGDGAVEGGVVVPISYALDDVWSLGMTPEIDLLKNTRDDGRHAALTDVIGLSRSLGDGVTLGVEIWGSKDFDPAGSSEQYSADLDAAWQPMFDSDLQLDGGVNFGLNANTPRTQIYLGISRRI
jgi:hypothetical protein